MCIVPEYIFGLVGGFKPEVLDKILTNYIFTEKTPMRDDVVGIMETRRARAPQRGRPCDREDQGLRGDLCGRRGLDLK